MEQPNSPWTSTRSHLPQHHPGEQALTHGPLRDTQHQKKGGSLQSPWHELWAHPVTPKCSDTPFLQPRLQRHPGGGQQAPRSPSLSLPPLGPVFLEIPISGAGLSGTGFPDTRANELTSHSRCQDTRKLWENLGEGRGNVPSHGRLGGRLKTESNQTQIVARPLPPCQTLTNEVPQFTYL